MPSHQDRVRRAYHDIKITEVDQPRTNDTLIQINISRMKIATAMSKRDVQYMVMKLIRDGINKGY